MDPEEAPQSRTAAFGEGMFGGAHTTASLYADSQRQNEAVPGQFTPTSVLHQIQLSPRNGNSDKDAERTLLGGGQLPTNNSFSNQTAQAARPILSKYASL